MNQIKVFFILIGLLIIFKTSAQKFEGSLVFGFSTSQIDRDTQKGYNKLGFYSGVTVKTKISDVWGVKIELYYIGKGAKSMIDGIEIFKTHLNYLEMPFLITVIPLDRFEIDFGISPAYLISSKLMQAGYEVSESEYNLYNYDFSGILSLLYSLTDNIAVNVRSTYSILPINDTPGWLNSNISFGLVYVFD